MPELLIDVIKSIIIIGALLTMMPYLTLFERRIISRLQVRMGPNRVGPAGLLQPLADGLKLFFKEDIAPAPADRPLYLLAPAISLFAAIAAFAVIPIGPTINLAGAQIPLVIADLQIGVLFLVGVSSLGVYGLVLGGWASGSKYSLLGGLRAAAQVVSYELIIGLALVGVVLVGGSLSLGDLVASQSRSVPFVLLQPLGFLLYLIAAVAEVNRAPFDLPEADTELVAGYHTEYSGMRWGLFQMAEYINMITLAALATTLFLGGWHGPGDSDWLGPAWFVLKVLLLIFVFMWMRATLPRLRYDQLMDLGWKILLPVTTLNAVVTAVLLVWL